jgi:hypothetical protein
MLRVVMAAVEGVLIVLISIMCFLCVSSNRLTDLYLVLQSESLSSLSSFIIFLPIFSIFISFFSISFSLGHLRPSKRPSLIMFLSLQLPDLVSLQYHPAWQP